MKVAVSLVRPARAVTRFAAAAASAAVLSLGAGMLANPAVAQAPILLPYTIQNLAGGGTSVAIPTGSNPPVLSTPCTGTNQVGVQYDPYGDGCNVSSTSVVTGIASDIHDVVVDQEGNVFFLDNGSSNARHPPHRRAHRHHHRLRRHLRLHADALLRHHRQIRRQLHSQRRQSQLWQPDHLRLRHRHLHARRLHRRLRQGARTRRRQKW